MKTCVKPYDASFIINGNIVFRLMDKEAVILDLDNGEYFSLNKTGTKIFLAITQKMTLREIVGSLCKDYKMKEDHLCPDIDALLAQLINNQIIREDKKNV